MRRRCPKQFFFFFNDTATTEIYTLSLHDALPICLLAQAWCQWQRVPSENPQIFALGAKELWETKRPLDRSEEHTSELQSRSDLVCRLLPEKKKSEPPSRTGGSPRSCTPHR